MIRFHTKDDAEVLKNILRAGKVRLICRKCGTVFVPSAWCPFCHEPSGIPTIDQLAVDLQADWNRCLLRAAKHGETLAHAARMFRQLRGIKPPSTLKNIPKGTSWTMNAMAWIRAKLAKKKTTRAT